MSFTEHYYTQFEFDNYYHIYNRGIDKKPIFLNEDNYLFFLRKYQKYIWPVAETLAYCIMGNHFHFVIKIRSKSEIEALPKLPEQFVYLGEKGPEWQIAPNASDALDATAASAAPDLTTFKKLSNLRGSIRDSELTNCHEIVFPQFRKLFQSYAMAFNKQQNRCGTLFQTPFKRALINSEDYLREAILYVHKNPVHHNIVLQIEQWPWSSYNLIIKNECTWLKINTIEELFGNNMMFIKHHAI